MSRRCVVLVTLAAVAGGLTGAQALAHPPGLVDEQGRAMRGKLHTWMHRAKVPLVRGRLEIRRLPCPVSASLAGCVYTRRPRVLYLRPNLHETRRILYHELGHVFDLVVLNGRERTRFKRIMRIRRDGWFQGGLPPAEWFADGYARCAVRLRGRARPTPYGYAPSRRQHARVCNLILAAAKPHGRKPQRPKNPPPVVEVEPPAQDDGGSGCSPVDQLLTGCKPPPPVPLPPAPVVG